MRHSILLAALLIAMAALPASAQRRGMAPRAGVSVGVRPSGRVVVGSGFRFGHNPRFGVFVGARPFHHHRRFFRPFVFGSPFAGSFGWYGAPYGYMAYPYYPYGLQSDFVYSGYASPPAADYNSGQNAVVVSDLQRLQSELDQIKQQQAIEREQASERRQYALDTPAGTPQPVPSARTRPEPPPTMLVYRDGRKVEARNYAFAGKTLWIFSEARAQKVPLDDLDLEATRKLNEERGVEFAPPPMAHVTTLPSRFQ